LSAQEEAEEEEEGGEGGEEEEEEEEEEEFPLRLAFAPSLLRWRARARARARKIAHARVALASAALLNIGFRDPRVIAGRRFARFTGTVHREGTDHCAAASSVNDQYLRSALDVDVYLLSLSLGN